MRDVRVAVTIPASVGPLPLRQARAQLYRARIRLHPKAAAYEEAVSVHRGVLPVAARDRGCRTLRAEQPLQDAVDSAHDSAIGFGETELNQAQQPPVCPLPLLIR